MMKKILIICLTMMLISLFYPISIANNNELPFILPEKGGGMAHSDQKMSDFINMPIPEEDVNVTWQRCDVPGEYGGSKGLGFSSNGEIAAASYSGLSNNLIIYDYDGNILWSSGGLLNALACASAPMIDIYGRVVACDNEVVIMVDTFDADSDGKIFEWKSKLVEGGLPISPTIVGETTVLIATTNGPVYAFDVNDGSLLAMEYLTENPDSGKSDGFYETINTPCVKGNRAYISTQFSKDNNPAKRRARLYAKDIDIDSADSNDRIKTAWSYDFDGPSGASPLLIGNTIYFDGNKSLQKNPFTMAVVDKGSYPELKWKASIPNPIDSSLARDPRGGFWLVDALGGKLIHQSEKDGSFIGKINTNDIIGEYGKHMPCSVITICGSKNRPILLTSALAMDALKSSCYVIAVDLSNNNNLIWKVRIFEGPATSIDFPFGQYPIVIKNGEPRVVFTTVRYGAWAIGSGGEDDSSVSRTVIPTKNQNLFTRLQTLIYSIYEKIKLPILKKILSNFLI